MATGIGDKLAFDGVCDEIPHPAYRGGKVIGVVMVLQPPVGVQGQPPGVSLIQCVLAGQQLPYVLEHTAARCAPGPRQHFSQTVGIHAGRHCRVGQQRL